MLDLYWGTFLFGGVLILSSIVMGGGDGDAEFDKDVSFDKDLSLDKDVDLSIEGIEGGSADFDSMGWLPFLSLRFWTFFTGLFGLNGIIMTTLGSGETTTLIASGVMSLGLSYPIAYLFQYLKRNELTSNTQTHTYEQEIGTALLPMKAHGNGKVRVSMGGELVDLIAQNPTSETIEQGQEVLIVQVEDGVAMVSPIQKITNSNTTT